jgi:hypothetical protein
MNDYTPEMSNTIDDVLFKSTLLCDHGEDSLVYKFDNQILKRYHSVPIDTLVDYQQITNAVAEDELIKDKYPGFQIHINPITQIEETRDLDPVTKSPLINGINIQDAINANQIDPETTSKVMTVLHNLSVDITNTYHTKGVNIIPWNVLATDQSFSDLHITDISQRVSEFSITKP